VSGRRGAAQRGAALHHDPLGDDQILERFYRPAREAQAVSAEPPGAAELGEPPPAPLVAQKPKPPKPAHYKIVCISLYNEDIERLERMVDTLKRRGHTKANKSQLIRAALDQVDLDKVPRSH
jgi:hypothetical protein